MSDKQQAATLEEAEEAPQAEAPKASVRPVPALPPSPPPSPTQKNPMAAAFLAAMPGLGHVYNGLYQRGTVFFLLFFGAITLTAESNVIFFAFCIPFVWLFNILDAYRQANLINHGYATDLGLMDVPKATPGLGALWAGIVLVAVGALELLRRFDLWDWDYIQKVWPAGLIVAGGWLIVSFIRNRSQRREEY